MDVREAMTDVVLRVGPTHTLREAARRMVERGVGAAVVDDPDAPGPGILTERDIVRALAAGTDPDRTAVGDFLTPTAVTADPSWSLEEAASTMLRGNFRHLVVVEDGRTVGVISVRDLMRVRLAALRQG